ncbi:MAG: glycosyltransferase family 4 protein [Oscillibacter sp.]|nr:glycosyltransferase family 4 protein [Oscillibacter sp.]
MTLRVSIVITDITSTGGTERTTILLANELLRADVDVSIISLFKKKEFPAFKIDSNIPIIYVYNAEYSESMSRVNRVWTLLKCLCKLKTVCRHKVADRYITVAFLPSFLLFLLGYAKYTIGWEHFKYSLYDSLMTKVRNYVYRHLRTIVTLTKNDTIAFHVKGINSMQIPNMSSFRKLVNEGENKKQLIAIGRLSFQKGYDLLLEAVHPVFKVHPDWILNIYGDGELKQALSEKIQVLKMGKNVILRGNTDDVQGVLRESSIFIMSSRFEGLPMVLLEALACGVPIISFNCKEGPAEICRDGCGILVPPENVGMLTDAIIALIEAPDKRKELQEKGWQRIKEYYPDRIIGKWLNILQ